MLTKVQVSLTTHELANVVSGLGRQIKGKRDALAKAQKRERASGLHKPGNVAGRAMELVELQDLRDRLVKSWTDAEQAEQDAQEALDCR